MVGVAPLVSLAWLISQLGAVVDGSVRTQHVDWVPALGLGIDLRLDGFGALMALLVSGVGVLIFAYAWSYLGDDPEAGRLAGLLGLFAGAMLGLVLADDVLLLFTCWEVTSITSYLLIAHHHDDPRARAAALHAVMVTGAGGLAMLGGFVVLARGAGSFRLSEILAASPTGVGATVALVLVLLGVATKSAQVPFHGWLPGAMTAPTPVSAYLHSATMVKAGLVVLARFAPAFAELGWWRPTVVGMGLATMLWAGLRTLRQQDLKRLLAFGTVSQLGFLAVLLGVGRPAATIAGCELLLAHGMFKAALFMTAGVIDHETGTRDLRSLPVLGRGWRTTRWTLLAAAASMAGLPLTFGFIAKEEALEAAADSGLAGGAWLTAGLVLGSALTVAYSLRLVWGVLVTPAREGRAEATRSPSGWFVAPAAVLAVASLVLGVRPRPLDGLVSAAAASLDPAADPVHLALWHGVNVPLGLSALAVALGVAAWLARRPLTPLLATFLPSGADVYLSTLRGLNHVATRVTAVVQNGSLPVYTGVILLTAAVLPSAALLRTGGWPDWPDLVDAPAHVPVAAVIIGSALAAATIRRRLSAILFLGMVGYGMAALFVVQGAPDLALTQVAIETLSTVLFVLVLRRLPDRFERRASRQRRVLRLVIAASVAAGVFVFALAAGGPQPTDPVADEMVDRALPDGHGRNVVNVILVDFRALDTLGEITVLATAAIGAVALARAGRRPGAGRPDGDGEVPAR